MPSVLERSFAEELSILDIDEDLIWHRDGDITVVYRLAAFHEPSLDDDAMNASALLAENAWSGLPEGTRYQFFVLLDRDGASRRLHEALPPIADGHVRAPLLEELRQSRLTELTSGDETLVAQERRHYLAATFRPARLRRNRLATVSASLWTAVGRLARRPILRSDDSLKRDVLLEAAHFERRVFRSLSSQEGLELHRCRGVDITRFAHELLSPSSSESLPALLPSTPILEDDVVVSRAHLRVGNYFLGVLSMKDLPDRTEPGLVVPLLDRKSVV